MSRPQVRTPVLVVGAGVAGSVLALELARHDVRSIVVERGSRPPRHPDLNLVRGRSMELLRRLGLATDIRRHGIDPDRPAEIIWSRGLDQPPVLVSRVPAATRVRGPDGGSPVEAYLRVTGADLARGLRAAARDHPLVDLREGWTFTDLRLEPDRAVAVALEAATGTRHVIEADHLAGCDGAQSTVRRCLGIPLDHAGAAAPHYTVHFRWAELSGRFERPSTIITERITLTGHPGRDRWIGHLRLSPAEAAAPDPVHLLRDRLGAGPDSVEILGGAQWDDADPVARTYRRGPAYLAGEAAHRFGPPGGPADTCIGDAVDLGWKLAASINGWAGPELLPSYESERRRGAILDRELLGRAREARSRFRRLAAAGASSGFLAEVLRREPPQVETAEAASDGGFDRPPAVRLDDGDHLYDRLGHQFTLVDLTGDSAGRPLTAAARDRGIPMTHLRLTGRAARAAWHGRLTLVRPDQHIAWRGDAPPGDWDGILDLVTGHRPVIT